MLEELRTPPPSAIRCAEAIFQRRTEERNQPRGTPLRWLGLAQKEQTLAQMNPGRGAKRPRSIRPYAMQSGKGRILLRAVLPTCPGRQWLGLFRPQHGPDPNRQFHGVFFGHHPAQPVRPELCLLEFSNGTPESSDGTLG